MLRRLNAEREMDYERRLRPRHAWGKCLWATFIALISALWTAVAGGCGFDEPPDSQPSFSTSAVLSSTIEPTDPGSNGEFAPADTYSSPSLSISAEPVFCCNSRSIVFEALLTNSWRFNEVTFQWDFGDRRSAEGPRVEHTYSWPGNYLVRVQARYGDGTELSAELTMSLPGETVPPPGLPVEPTDGNETPADNEPLAEEDEPPADNEPLGDETEPLDEIVLDDTDEVAIPDTASDAQLRCMVNLSGYALSYPPDRWANVPLITDLTVWTVSTPNVQETFEQVVDTIQFTNSQAVFGTYISGGRVEPVFAQYPPEAVAKDLIPAQWLRTDWTNYVNLSNHEAADTFAGLIGESCRNRAGQVVFLDNIVHPSALSTWTDWSDTCRFLTLVRDKLHLFGKSVIANIAVSAWSMSDVDVQLLSDAVDGMAFEMPFHSTARGNQERTQRLIEVYRAWLRDGKIVVLIPLAPPENRHLEARLMAGFAMMVREPGDQLYVSWPFYQVAPDWTFWPRQFGKSLGAYEFEDNGVLVRRFAHGEIHVDSRNSAVTIRTDR